TEVALTAFAEVLEIDPENVDAKAHLSRVYIKLGEIEAAQSLLEEIQETHQDNPNVSAAVTALSLALNAADAGELAPLLQKVDNNPDDLEARFELAQGLIGNENYEDGGAQLIEIIKRDLEWNESAARAELLKMFEVLGQMHETTKDFRRQLSSVLFS
ncbi:MAG: tetratricopeptide repeat protein, partial [Sneathiella sp.]|nr:tetratricopeptide repeat protein [Sneathiella sp.]